MRTKKNKLRSILFITQGGINTASSRFRVFSFIDKFHENNVKTKILALPTGGHPFSRILFLLGVFINAPKYQTIFIQKVLLPIWALKLLHSINNRIVYDWDDALFSPPPSNILTAKKIKNNKSKLDYILSNCVLAICGNRYIEKYAKQFSQKTAVIPTSVDDKQLKKVKENADSSINIGWIGRSENLIYLNDLRDIFVKLEKKYGKEIRFKIVCDQTLILDGVHNIDNIKWRLGNELSDIRSFDIGIMPLSDNEWTRGKCAFKLLQYMAAGVPCIGSPVGANNEVISHNQNGILAESTNDWLQGLEELIEYPEKRKLFAKNAKETIKNRYSINVVFHKLFVALDRN
ncbi:MAG: glycosyltransferase family 4 protein [Gammaproteobacteria bacterium]|nr:glycosyltransferase family 4 protein [Gammaproteobacteria bacterium]